MLADGLDERPVGKVAAWNLDVVEAVFHYLFDRHFIPRRADGQKPRIDNRVFQFFVLIPRQVSFREPFHVLQVHPVPVSRVDAGLKIAVLELDGKAERKIDYDSPEFLDDAETYSYITVVVVGHLEDEEWFIFGSTHFAPSAASSVRISAASSRLMCSFGSRTASAAFRVRKNMLSPPHRGPSRLIASPCATISCHSWKSSLPG